MLITFIGGGNMATALIGGLANPPRAHLEIRVSDPSANARKHLSDTFGVSTFDGHPGFEVRRIWPHGREDILFFSAESGLLTLMRYPHPFGGEYWASFWDYQDVGGVTFPFVHITTLDFDPLPHGLMVESIELNVPLPDSLFTPPGGR